MTKVSSSKYKVSEDQFDEIFTPCFSFPGTPGTEEEQKFNGELTNKSVGQIQNNYFDTIKAVDITAFGTGTIIKNKEDKIHVITAKHLFETIGDIEFILGMSCLTPTNQNINYLANSASTAKSFSTGRTFFQSIHCCIKFELSGP